MTSNQKWQRRPSVKESTEGYRLGPFFSTFSRQTGRWAGDKFMAMLWPLPHGQAKTAHFGRFGFPMTASVRWGGSSIVHCPKNVLQSFPS